MNIHVKGIIKKLKSINKEPIFKCSKHFSFHYYDSWPVNVFAVVFICLKKCIGSILIGPPPYIILPYKRNTCTFNEEIKNKTSCDDNLQ